MIKEYKEHYILIYTLNSMYSIELIKKRCIRSKQR